MAAYFTEPDTVKRDEIAATRTVRNEDAFLT
jgi:hypothetical protein